MKRLTVLIILLSLLTLLFIISCNKKSSKVSEASSPTTPQQKIPENNISKKEVKEQKGGHIQKNIIVLGEKKNVKKKESFTSNVKYTTGGINFLKDRRGNFVTPEDFKIGILQRNFAIDATTYKQYSIIKKFLESLKLGRINKKVIEPTEKENIVKLLSYHLKAGQIPLSYRIGKIITDKNNTITANIRLIGKSTSAEGQVYLTHKDKEWFIRNIQIDFASLTQKGATSKGEKNAKKPFNPSRFEWMLKNNQ